MKDNKNKDFGKNSKNYTPKDNRNSYKDKPVKN